MKKDIRNHPYHFEQALQRQNGSQCTSISTVPPAADFSPNNNNGLLPTYELQHKQHQQQQIKSKNSTYFTWLVFMYAKWVPFDGINQGKLEQSQQLGGTFVDIEDSNFPKVKRVRVFPKSNYLSYLGVKYRLSRVMQPDAWTDSHDLATPSHRQPQQHIMTRSLPPPTTSPSDSISATTTVPPSSHSASSTMDLKYWRSSSHGSSQTLISHVIS
ncbi:hypothetical protein BCR42DRAFT_428697 [Absidia repens]|uniref:WWE domain-containing protein n=1 Tax=Absidia repens TaxID=90262 RepID=A0A1X2HY20_9FUNG|nr:hypothetical protein BCR42DRAFT_428697 [Absidia repens]